MVGNAASRGQLFYPLPALPLPAPCCSSRPCGGVTAADQEYAAARLTEIQVARAAKRAAAAAGMRTAKQAAAVAPVSVTKVPTLKAKPVLHLPAINR